MTSVVNQNTLVLRLAKVAIYHFLDVVKLGVQCRAEDGMQILEPGSPDVVGEVREVPSLVSVAEYSEEEGLHRVAVLDKGGLQQLAEHQSLYNRNVLCIGGGCKAGGDMVQLRRIPLSCCEEVLEIDQLDGALVVCILAPLAPDLNGTGVFVL